MSTSGPSDSKREEFRRYLEKTGAMEVMTKVMSTLYGEADKPADALEYIRKHLGECCTEPDDTELNAVKADLVESNMKIETLEKELKLLKELLAKYEPEEDTTVVEEENDGEQSIGGGSGMGDALPAEGAETAANTSAEVSQPALQ